jgi:hypothetical protein
VRARRLALLLAVAGCAAGCGATAATSANAPESRQAVARESRLAVAQRTHEYPSPPPRQTAASGSRSPTFVIQAFATAYINWSYRSVTATMRALTQLSIGQARSEMALAAAQTAEDYELRRGGISNAGVVEAIAPLLGHSREYAVVTRELTTAVHTAAYQGLRPAWHLSLATVTRMPSGEWVLSSWQPEN